LKYLNVWFLIIFKWFVAMLEKIFFNIGVIAPIFILILLGILLKYINLIDEHFVRKSSQFIFKVSLPALIFQKLSQINFHSVFNFKMIYIALAFTIVQFFVAWIVSGKLTNLPENKGVIVQGAVRSNFAIIGLAVLLNLFGDNAVGKASILLSFIMPLYNLLGVVALLLPFQSSIKFDVLKFLKELALNPLILSVVISLPFSYKLVAAPLLFTKVVGYLSPIALPLALVNIGATVDLKKLVKASGIAYYVSFLKIGVFPLLFTPTLILIGFRGVDLVVLFTLFACPTAIATFPMAEGMKGNIKLASGIIVITTSISVLTLSIGYGVLKYYGFI